MRVLFRTDANAQIGTGHLMRCLALADVLRQEGAECAFLCRSNGLGALAQKLLDAGHALVDLPDLAASDLADDLPVLPHANWLPGGWKSDATSCLNRLEGLPVADWLIVDHYALDIRWERAMRGRATRLMVIDDLADRQHDCDVLLDQNRVRDMDTRYDGCLPESCKELLGPRYALLRPEFSLESALLDRGMSAELPRLLVMFGGADAQNLTLRTVTLLARTGWSGRVDVVAGPLYSGLPSLKSAVSALPDAQLHSPAVDVATLMRSADLAVGSPGVASWERCACALPSVTIAQADNQEAIGEELAVLGVHLYLGRAELVSDAELASVLNLYLMNSFARQAMSKAAAQVCDGRGARRVAKDMLASSFCLRRANSEDAHLLFSWRNDERTRRYFFDPSPIDINGHLEWFSKTLRSASSILLVAERNSIPVACIRFDCRESSAMVSIYLDPNVQGQGIGVPVLSQSTNWMFVNRPEVATVEADVLAGNESSKKTFLGAGFKPVCSRYELSRGGQ